MGSDKNVLFWEKWNNISVIMYEKIILVEFIFNCILSVRWKW